MKTTKKFGRAALAAVLGATLMVPAASAFAATAEEPSAAPSIMEVQKAKKTSIKKAVVNYKVSKDNKVSIKSVTLNGKKLKAGTDYTAKNKKVNYYDANGKALSKRTKAAKAKRVQFDVVGKGAYKDKITLVYSAAI